MKPLTLRQYLNFLTEIATTHPEALDMQIVSSSDDEGNSFGNVYFAPTLGFFDGNDFIPEGEENNCICIN